MNGREHHGGTAASLDPVGRLGPTGRGAGLREANSTMRFDGRLGRAKRSQARWGRTEPGNRPAWPPRPIVARTPGGRPRVLVVEDDAPFREYVVGVLSNAGYEVCEAADGGDLLEKVADVATKDGIDPEPFSAILTDVRMPGISGADAIELLRNGPWRHTPTIMMTAFSDSQIRARAARLGVAAVLDKPFDADRLCQVLGEVAPVS